MYRATAPLRLLSVVLPAGYTFYWFKGTPATPNTTAADFAGVTYSNLGAGFYTVIAENTALGCQSAKATVQVLDNTVLPVITVTSTSQTSCDPAGHNGSASANVGGVTAGYTFTWYKGASATGGSIFTGAVTTSTLDAGTYTVKAVNDATGYCQHGPGISSRCPGYTGGNSICYTDDDM